MNSAEFLPPNPRVRLRPVDARRPPKEYVEGLLETWKIVQEAKKFASSNDDTNSQSSQSSAEELAEDNDPAKETFVYKGHTFVRHSENIDPWYKVFLESKRVTSQKLEAEEEEPFHFDCHESPESDDDLRRQRLFVDPNDVDFVPPVTTDMDEGDDNDEILKDLYDDLDNLDLTNVNADVPDDGSETRCSSITLPPSVKHTRQDEYKNYRRFYNFNEESQYEENLSVFHSRQTILSSIENNRVTIVVGPTGTGKTTQIPLYILDACAKNGQHCNMMVTQPRRLAAFTNAARVASLRKDRRGRPWKLGHLIGYHVGLSRMVTRATCVTFCTTAIFLKIAASELDLKRFTHVFLDEAHERGQDVDIALMLVKKMMQENSPHTKLIIMSATMNVDKIRKYFADEHASLTPGVVELSHSFSLPIEEHFLDDLCPNRRKWPAFSPQDPQLHKVIFDEAVALLGRLPDCYVPPSENSGRFVGLRDRKNEVALGAVLMFLPGIAEINDFEQALLRLINEKRLNWEIQTLHASYSKEAQARVMNVPPANVRRIILSTNIAESSVTIPYVVYVIDFGLTKRQIMDEQLGLPRLAVQWASKANMTQRKGRCGRVRAGVYYCMVSRDFYDSGLLDHEDPDIKVAPMHHSILHVKVLDLPREWKPHDLFKLLLDPPDKKKVDIGILQLKEVGALSLKMHGKICLDNGELTDIGRILESLPVDINVGRFLIFAYVFGVLDHALPIAAGISLHSLFSTPLDSQTALDDWMYKRAMYEADSGSDCLRILLVWRLYKLAHQANAFNWATSEQWFEDHRLSLSRFKEMKWLIDELQMRLTNLGMYYPHGSALDEVTAEQKDVLRVILAAAFYPNFFVQEPIISRIASEVVLYGDPQLTLEFTNLPGNEAPLYEDQLRRNIGPYQHFNGIPPEIIYTSGNVNDKAYVSFSRHSLGAATSVASGIDLALRVTRGANRHKQSFSLVPAPRGYTSRIKTLIAEWKRGQVLESMLFLGRNNYAPRTVIIPPAAIPIDMTTKFPICVLNVLTCDRIFVRLADAHTTDRFKDMHNQLQALKTLPRNHPGLPQPLPAAPAPGDFVLALKEASNRLEIVHRVQLVSYFPEKKKFWAFGIDVAEYFEVKADLIRAIPPPFHSIPAFAFEFRFAGIHVRELKLDEVENFLKKSGVLLQEGNRQPVQLQIYSVLRSVVRGSLHVNNSVTGYADVNLNDELVRLGFASPSIEPYMSQISHENPAGLSHHGPDIKLLDIPLEEVKPTVKKIPVNGPYCPIVCKFKSIVQQWNACDVGCPQDSLNHRVLDGCPELSEVCQRVLVAPVVEGAGKSDHRIVLRNSTLLPRHPGLLAVLVTLFAPCVQLKTNKSVSGEGYAGCIAGVGFAPSKDGKKALSLYPEHDIRAQFDVVLTPLDVDELDDLRLMINTVIGKIQRIRLKRKDEIEANTNELVKFQSNCRSLLFEILAKPRKPCDGFSKRNYAMTYQFSLKDRPKDAVANGLTDLMLQPLYMAELPDRDVLLENERLRAANNKLHQEAVLSFTTSERDKRVELADVVNSFCEICREFLNRRQEIASHIHSEAHRTRERALGIWCFVKRTELNL